MKNNQEKLQRRLINNYATYNEVRDKIKNEHNREILTEMSEIILAGVKRISKTKVRINKVMVNFNVLLYYVFGYEFLLNLISKTKYYDNREVITLINELEEEDKLKFVGSVVLGLNDALVELTGTIAGLTFALTSTRLVALSGIVTGISATLSMAASNYLAERAAGNPEALKSSMYTGVAYLITVLLMVLPYLIFPNEMYAYALVVMLLIVVSIIILFNLYISIAQNKPFLPNFLTMATISLGVAFIAFIIGLLAKRFLGVDL